MNNFLFVTVCYVICIVFVGTRVSAQPYVATGGPAVKEVVNFEEGIDFWAPAPSNSPSYAPHFWTTNSPTYNYPHAPFPDNIPWWSQVNYAWTPPQSDNVNWWHTLSPVDSSYTNGYADMDMQLYLPQLGNYANWQQYDTILVKWMGGNPSNNTVELEVFAHSPNNPDNWFSLFHTFRSVDGVQQEQASLLAMSPNELSAVDIMKFRVFNTYIEAGQDYNQYQRTHIYNVKVVQSSPPNKTLTFGGVTTNSGFLGTMYYSRYGRYSASGFYDENAKVWKVWAGGGVPEAPSCDNVWYHEFATLPTPLDAEELTPIRCNMNSNGELWPASGPQYGYGGDPSVIMINGQYIMYFSGLKKVTPSWNQIYRAVSGDGVNWDLSPQAPVVAATPGVAGYGSGSPAVVVMNGTYYLWYYSQCEPYCNGGGTPQPGLWLQLSADGVNFNTPQFCGINTAADVKYVDSIGLFVGTYYYQTQSDCGTQVGIAYSKDGVNWIWDPSNVGDIGQDASACLNHNPGWLGDPLGHGWPNMYLTYGSSETPIGLWEYYTRQLQYSWVSMQI